MEIKDVLGSFGMEGDVRQIYKGKPYENGLALGRLAARRVMPDDSGCPAGDCILEECRAKKIRVPKAVLQYCRDFGPLYRALPWQPTERNARLHDLCYLGAAMLAGNYRKPRRLRRWKKIFRGVLRGYGEISPLTARERGAVPFMFVYIELRYAAVASKNGEGRTAKGCLRMAKWLYRRRRMLAKIGYNN